MASQADIIKKFCDCGCKTEIALDRRYANGHNRNKNGIYVEIEKCPSQSCDCGCGEMTNKGRKFIHGHNGNGSKGKSKHPKIILNHHSCECGCGTLVASNKRFVNSHNNYKYGYYEIPNEIVLCKCGCGKKVNWNGFRKCWNEYINHHHTPVEYHSEETLKKMRRPRSEEGKRNIKLAMARPEVIAKISGANSYLWKGGDNIFLFSRLDR